MYLTSLLVACRYRSRKLFFILSQICSRSSSVDSGRGAIKTSSPYPRAASTYASVESKGSGSYSRCALVILNRHSWAILTGTHLRRDTVIPQWFQASKAAAASDGHAVHCWVTAVICQLSRLKRIPLLIKMTFTLMMCFLRWRQHF